MHLRMSPTRAKSSAAADIFARFHDGANLRRAPTMSGGLHALEMSREAAKTPSKEEKY